ncbi:hypothetical protein LguiA_004821 [Lonicera macranthoides]
MTLSSTAKLLEHRSSRSALFDGLDGIEEGVLRASSSYSRDIDEHDNEKAMDGLQNRVVFLKRVSFFIEFIVFPFQFIFATWTMVHFLHFCWFLE